MSALHPAVGRHKALRDVERRQADLARRNATLAEARTHLDEQNRHALLAHDAAVAAALQGDGPLPAPPPPVDGSALTRAQLGLVQEREALLDAERAALRDHADEHRAALAKAEDALLADLAPHAEAIVARLEEARLLQDTAVRIVTATRPGSRPRVPALDVCRLVEVVLGGGRLADHGPPVADGDFYATLQASAVEG